VKSNTRPSALLQVNPNHYIKISTMLTTHLPPDAEIDEDDPEDPRSQRAEHEESYQEFGDFDGFPATIPTTLAAAIGGPAYLVPQPRDIVASIEDVSSDSTRTSRSPSSKIDKQADAIWKNIALLSHFHVVPLTSMTPIFEENHAILRRLCSALSA
jgi:hypothetical protein